MKICITSDVHFERVLHEPDGYDNMVKYFKETLEYIKPDVFIVAGDLTDSRNLRFETPEALKLTEFMEFLLKTTSDLKCECVILKGTPSHDGDIVKNLTPITSKYSNFIHIDTITRMCIRGVDFVFIPEIYSPTEDEFMSDLYQTVNVHNKCDIIVFHGMFDFAIPAVKQIDSKHNLSRSVVMNSAKISKLANLVIGGHVHAFMNERNIYYTGRFINERGQDHNGTFGIKFIEYQDDKKFKIINVDNHYVIKMKSVNIDLVNYQYDDEKIRQASMNDPMSTIYRVYITDKSSVNFKNWKTAYSPVYIKRVVMNSTQSSSSTNGTGVDNMGSMVSNLDVKSLLRTIYKDKFGEELSDEIINLIEYGDDVNVK